MYLANDVVQNSKKKGQEFAKEFGSYCQFDLFGIENSYYQTKPEIDFFR